MSDHHSARRADVDAKQAVVHSILSSLECEGVVLVVPAHVAWFTGGMNVRGLIAEGERPGVYTTGRTRWLACGNADSQRLFDEELDGLGFMLKEWNWATGRAQLLGELVAGKRVASDRPFPGMPLVNDKLRPELRTLSEYDRGRLLDLGGVVAHALEATGRTLRRGDTEAEVAGQLAHRALHHGADVHSLSVTADARGDRFRRAGFTDAPVEAVCAMQLTATRGGLFVTAGRTVGFGPPPDAVRAAHDLACKLAAVYRAKSRPGLTVGDAVDAGQVVVRPTEYEHDWRLSPPGYATGWHPADEMRKAGQDEPFADAQPLVWQPRVGAAAAVDTVLTADAGAEAVTPPGDWPFKRIAFDGRGYDVPDLLVRTG